MQCIRSKKITQLLAVLSIAIPLVFILLAILLSPWFDIVNNALSDLGHSVKSKAAPVFNIGLVTGGFLIALVDFCMLDCSRLYRALLFLAGYDLILIGVFDEVYISLHFYVSLVFFTILVILLLVYGVLERKYYFAPLAIISMLSWYLHFSRDIPPGAAIPELVTIAFIIPVYMSIVFRTRGEVKKVGLEKQG